MNIPEEFEDVHFNINAELSSLPMASLVNLSPGLLNEKHSMVGRTLGHTNQLFDTIAALGPPRYDPSRIAGGFSYVGGGGAESA